MNRLVVYSYSKDLTTLIYIPTVIIGVIIFVALNDYNIMKRLPSDLPSTSLSFLLLLIVFFLPLISLVVSQIIHFFAFRIVRFLFSIARIEIILVVLILMNCLNYLLARIASLLLGFLDWDSIFEGYMMSFRALFNVLAFSILSTL